MPNYIIKPDQNVDEYVLWSTVPDAPVSGVLDRAGMTSYLTAQYWQLHSREEADQRLERADQTGISARFDAGAEQYVRVETEWMPFIDGDVPNSRVADLVRALDAHDESAVRRPIKEGTDDQDD